MRISKKNNYVCADLRKVYSAGAIPGIGVYGSLPGEVEMAQMLKALTQRFQRHQLTDYPNQVKVSDRYGDSSPGFYAVLCELPSETTLCSCLTFRICFL